MKPLLRRELDDGCLYKCILSGKYVIVKIDQFKSGVGVTQTTYTGTFFHDGYQTFPILDNQLTKVVFDNQLMKVDGTELNNSNPCPEVEKQSQPSS